MVIMPPLVWLSGQRSPDNVVRTGCGFLVRAIWMAGDFTGTMPGRMPRDVLPYMVLASMDLPVQVSRLAPGSRMPRGCIAGPQAGQPGIRF